MAGVTTRLAVLILAMTATVAGTACGGDAGDDKAGGSGPSVELRLANTGGEIAQTPAVEYFVERVEELSGGKVRIEVVNRWAQFAPDAEQQVVHDVAARDVDLGWVGSRVFDTLGVNSFEALTAPMLIDSYALEDAVIERGVTAKMLAGRRRTGGARPRRPRGRLAAADRRRRADSRARGLERNQVRDPEVGGPGRGDPSARGRPGGDLRSAPQGSRRRRNAPGFRVRPLAVHRPAVVISRSLRGRQCASLAPDGRSARESRTSRAIDLNAARMAGGGGEGRGAPIRRARGQGWQGPRRGVPGGRPLRRGHGGGPRGTARGLRTRVCEPPTGLGDEGLHRPHPRAEAVDSRRARPFCPVRVHRHGPRSADGRSREAAVVSERDLPLGAHPEGRGQGRGYRDELPARQHGHA